MGYTGSDVMDDSPALTIFLATASAGLDNIKAHFLYLKSSCTLADMKAASTRLAPSARVHIVKPPSLKLQEETIRSIFGRDTSIHEPGQLVWGKLKSLFSGYITSLENIPLEKYYICPRSSDPQIGDNLSRALLDYLRGTHPTDDGLITVVRANAGVGKTTLARYLVDELRKSVEKDHRIPVFVEAQHWSKLHLDSVESLWEVIDNSLRRFTDEPLLRESLFRYALQQGYICFIFDGFDELCGRRSSAFNPEDILADLARIVEESAARILLTTRTLYWNSQLSVTPRNCRIFDVDAFNTQQAT